MQEVQEVTVPAHYRQGAVHFLHYWVIPTGTSIVLLGQIE